MYTIQSYISTIQTYNTIEILTGQKVSIGSEDMQRFLILALALDFLFCQPSKRPPFDQIELELPGGTKVGSGSLFLIYSLTKQGQG